MSPLLVRIFTLVGMALAAASMQLKARADPLAEPHVQQVHADACSVAGNDRPST